MNFKHEHPQTTKEECGVAQVIPETPPNFDRARIIERPDGVYWQDKETEEEYGPFSTIVEAVADMQITDSASIEREPVETLEEAESEIGVSEWIDPDTGEPAEDNVPRLEDH